ncbi:MAG TPA: hypothetical protein DCF42_04045 [Lachnospiraceae bacterium]|nr:hypothetical protein [Lachnospiraceae bacterium]
MKNTAEEIFHRMEIEKRKKEKRTIKALSAGTLVLLIALLGFISRIPISGKIEMKQTLYGAYLLKPELGRYVLMAVILCAAGMILAAAVKKYRQLEKEMH